MQKNYRPKKTQREHAAKARPQACLSALGRLPGEWDTTLLCSPCSLLCSKARTLLQLLLVRCWRHAHT